MIPKIIHYVWLGNDRKPALIRKCIASWRRVMPDWEIKLWSMENIPHNAWVDEAISAKKWAFAADYIRAFALYTYGGVYFDSDIFLRKRMDGFLDCSFFTGIEYNEEKFLSTGSSLLLDSEGKKKSPDAVVRGLSVQSAIIGAEKGCAYIKDILSFYEERHLIKEDGSYFLEMLAPDVQAFAIEKYGFRYADTFQKLNGGVCIPYKSVRERHTKCGQKLLCDSCVFIYVENVFRDSETCLQTENADESVDAALIFGRWL